MIVTRFAPSPTGFLHLGHAFAAITAFDAAQAGGRFLLRIEDLDTGRCRPNSKHAIFEDLRLAGPGLGRCRCCASRRAPDAYRAALTRLDAMGLRLSLLLHPQGDRRRNRAQRRSAA